ncbi:hypothetical protein ACIP79_11800 [Streptomyces sp. NPDC088747]|uniref:hypothetical protein n=1 Tax=Streptomyces sp. NPDC088747 TaxID=3365886 RepID=UPI0037FECAE5
MSFTARAGRLQKSSRVEVLASPAGHVVPPTELRRPLPPPRTSRTTLAKLLLDEAEAGRHGNGIVVPLS